MPAYGRPQPRQIPGVWGGDAGLAALSEQAANALAQPEVVNPPLPQRPQQPFIGQGIQPRPIPADIATIGNDNSLPIPSGFDATQSTRGSASWNGPQLNNEAALSGLQAGQSRQDPRFERIRLAHSMQTGDMGDTGYGNKILADVGQSFAPQMAEVNQAQGAIQSQHPAIRGLAEQTATQRSYPQIEEAQGRTQAAALTGKAAMQGDMFRAGASDRAASGDILQEIIKQRGEAQARSRGFDDSNFEQKNVQDEQALEALMQYFLQRYNGGQ